MNYLRFLLLSFCLIPISCLAGTRYNFGLPQVNVNTNLPFFYGTAITITNATSNLIIDILHDGILVRPNLSPGQSFSLGMKNWSGSSQVQTSFVAVGKDGGKNLVGVATRSFYISSYARQSENWLVTESQLTNRSSW